MNIIGINGLGVTPSACLVQDGKLIAMAEEERFNRLKGSFGMLPEKATKFCLDYGGLKLDDINYIAFPWDAYRYRFYMPSFYFYICLKYALGAQSDGIIKGLEQILKFQPSRIKNLISTMVHNAGIKGRMPPIKFIPHHLSHAASAFYPAGLDKAYILVIDGSGEDKCTTVFKGEGLEIKERKSFRMPNSLGWFYQSITEYLGFLPNRHEGKTMALAAFGRYDKLIYSKLNKIISFNENGDYKYDASYSFLGKHVHGTICSEKMIKLIGSKRYHKDPIEQIHKDIAFSAQGILEKIAVSIVREISLNHDYDKKLCISGGVALNCKMNGAIAEEDCIEQIFIPPFSNDSGSALGAALYLSKEKGYNPKFKMEHAYWGPEFSNEDIKELLIKIGARYKEDPEIELTVAKLLSENKIVGWFQGRMEVGPRALGARSILANPAQDWIKQNINIKIKNRELWRPFALSILDEKKHEYIIQPKDSPFMTLTFKVSEEIKKRIPAVIHLDNTTRPHFVKKEINQRFWRLIKEFEKINGIPVILNTSFNANEEPIVCTPEQALRTFYATGLDYLALGDFLVYK